MVDIPCDYCGCPASSVVDEAGNCSCMNCFNQFYTCAMCENAQYCAFEQDPSPLPRQVQQTIQRGPMIMQTTVKNPERVKQFCFPCKCFSQDELLCLRIDSWCKSYVEITPRFRQERLDNT